MLNRFFQLLLDTMSAASIGGGIGGGGGGNGNSNNNSGLNPANLINSSGHKMMGGGRDYESIKEQFDQAMTELNGVRMQYLDSKRRCDNAQEKLDYYIEQYTTAMSQLEVALQDSSVLREKYTETSNEKIRWGNKSFLIAGARNNITLHKKYYIYNLNQWKNQKPLYL